MFKVSQELKHVVQRGCGISILREAQNWTGQGPEQPELIWPCSERA